MKHHSEQTIKEQSRSPELVCYELCYQRHPPKIWPHLLSVTDLEWNCLNKSQLTANIWTLSPLTMNEPGCKSRRLGPLLSRNRCHKQQTFRLQRQRDAGGCLGFGGFTICCWMNSFPVPIKSRLCSWHEITYFAKRWIFWAKLILRVGSQRRQAIEHRGLSGCH